MGALLLLQGLRQNALVERSPVVLFPLGLPPGYRRFLAVQMEAGWRSPPHINRGGCNDDGS